MIYISLSLLLFVEGSKSSAKRPAPEFRARRRLASVFATDALSEIPSVELIPTEGHGSFMQQMLGVFNSNMQLFMVCLIDSSFTFFLLYRYRGGRDARAR